ncbi:MAG: ComF family protein [Termitinemataceae bacterium]|nr:MAG: ComF family protein [Termitinemataceae bacterium]
MQDVFVFCKIYSKKSKQDAPPHLHYSMKYLDFKILSLIREIIFPCACPICGENLLERSEAFTGICKICAQTHTIDSSPRCSVCGKPLISEIGICINCRSTPASEIHCLTFAIFPYLGSGAQLLHAYKFGAHRNLSRFFAAKLLDARNIQVGGTAPLPTKVCFANVFSSPPAVLGTQLPESAKSDAVWVPVPPKSGKLKVKGWDQIETIARVLEKHQDVKVDRCLKRLAGTQSQKELGKDERKKNLVGKIICTKAPPQNVILFDDVYTTGSTIQTCAEVLKKEGCKNVSAICLYYD